MIEGVTLQLAYQRKNAVLKTCPIKYCKKCRKKLVRALRYGGGLNLENRTDFLKRKFCGMKCYTKWRKGRGQNKGKKGDEFYADENNGIG